MKQIFKRTAVASFAGLGVYLSYAIYLHNSPKHDLDLICNLAKSSEQQDTSRDPLLRAQEFGTFINTHVYSTPVRRILSALAQASPPGKYALLLKGAQEVGYSEWSCPELQLMWNH